MEDLFLKTEHGNILIDPKLVKKYNLKKGSISPFSREPVVDKFGSSAVAETEKISISNGPGDKSDEDVAETSDGFMLSSSEVIDFSEGADSYI